MKYISFLLLLISAPLWAQDSLRFAQEDLFALILTNHPLTKQADLKRLAGDAQIQRAKGAFDPQFYTYLDQKVYKGTNYYRILDGGFKVPTWFGIEGKAEINQANGANINSENTLPANGLAVVGLSVPLAQGLLIDGRRAALFQARIARQASEAERAEAINELFYEAMAAYWTWAEAWYEKGIYQQAVNNAQIRFEGVRVAWKLGDRAAIDTLEALTQVQSRELELQKAQLAEQNARLFLSNFIWNEKQEPLEMQANLAPQAIQQVANMPSADALTFAENMLPYTHFSLQQYQFKLEMLEIERRLKAEKLKPKVNLEYNLLTQELGKTPIFPTDVWAKNYKWGLAISMPILLREARGDMQLAKIKIQDAQYSLQNKQRELTNKLRIAYNDALRLQTQIELFDKTLLNYQSLLSGEEVRFRAGESSVFLINSRESKLIETQIKGVELRAKYFKSLNAYKFAAGNLYVE